MYANRPARQHAREAAENGLYDPRTEHGSCGLGFVATLDGCANRGLVERALGLLSRLAHRGATGSDSLTGDGAGILTSIPHWLLARELARDGVDLPGPGQYGLGMLFLPPEDEQASRDRVTAALARHQLDVLAWRDVPLDLTAAGPDALASLPRIVQVVAVPRRAMPEADLERVLFLARRLAERDAPDAFYICSMSSRTVVYKGLLLPERLALFFTDLGNQAYEAHVAVVHQRFSTNTFPAWKRAHPYRMLAHNGEINTILGNSNRMRSRVTLLDDSIFGVDPAELGHLVDLEGSDSAMLDNALELVHHSGRTLPHALSMLVPSAWEQQEGLSPSERAFWRYHDVMMEPWDGPAALVFTDGRGVGAALDRNGLRPCRWIATTDDQLILASEDGVVDIPPDQVAQRGRLAPGGMLWVDLEKGRWHHTDALRARMARARPWAAWLAGHQTHLDALAPAPEPAPLTGAALQRALRSWGLTREDLSKVLGPMAEHGKPPTGAMGNDTPLAVLSEQPQLLSAYFRQRFAQVTNPPVDPLREASVMSLRTLLGPKDDPFREGPLRGQTIVLDGPVLMPEELARVEASDTLSVRTIATRFQPGDHPADALQARLIALCAEAEQSVRDGAGLLILSDRTADDAHPPIPSLLATSAVHHHLTDLGLRSRVALVVDTGEAREVMHLALLCGFGAEAVCPWLAVATCRDLAVRGEVEVTADQAAENVRKAFQLGLRKVLAKMGICTLRSYHGSQIFEILGLSSDFAERWFPGTPARLEGIGMEGVAQEVLHRHRAGAEADPDAPLEVGGRYQWRRAGERHAWDPNALMLLQHSVRSGRREMFTRYTTEVNARSRHFHFLRGLLDPVETTAIPIDEVEPVSEIVRRFRTGAMSFGSLSAEAHENLAIAMNRLGARSNSGEGGEDPRRNTPLPNGDSRRSAIKQVASGRFGVTPEYLVAADEIQIKMAQGAKPGEGGQLPGRKVNDAIARTRHSVPGVGLISPPPHHDIYSIEDLAQLIEDLQRANDEAEISVKLVSEVGVGTIAAGVAKAGADGILISGSSGGTGASPLGSVQHAGVPWELGLAETQQVLRANGLRSRVRVEVDGQLKTGRDVIVAALLGAERFGFGTSALVASGCVLMRACHLDTCPVGVATQDPALRARFAGQPEHVERMMLWIAEEVREWMARLGFRTMDALIGRTDRLEVTDLDAHWKARHLKLEQLLHGPVAAGPRIGTERPPRRDGGLGQILLEESRAAIRRGTPVTLSKWIHNTDRVVGTALSSAIVRRHGAAGLPEGTIDLRLRGIAGQSFGAFLAPGVQITLEGAANDGVGKGLAGGRLVIRTDRQARGEAEDQVVVGNTALYGATSGEIFIRGQAGERFAVRNSGATAVVEGVGDHACEYMTGGTVVNLGLAGRNIAAGMSGGLAFFVEPERTFEAGVNRAGVDLVSPDADDWALIQALLRQHHRLTDSPVAWRILSDWRAERPRVVKVLPHEYRRYLEQYGTEHRRVVGL